MNTLLVVSVIWVAAEMMLSVCKRSSENSVDDKDHISSLIIWTTITIAVSLGVYAGETKFGFLGNQFAALYSIGIVLIIVGLLIRWVSILSRGKYFTVDVSIRSGHKMIQTGLYQVARHPSYFGMLLSFLGLGISFISWVSTLVIVIPITAAVLYRVSIEEKVLLQTFGDAYKEYCQRVKSLVPYVY